MNSVYVITMKDKILWQENDVLAVKVRIFSTISSLICNARVERKVR